ncbi:3-deoxy-D-manno-octulosonate cytidylyltransferase [Belliella baltica DSM 15883]|uniref:3-deoxy-manno-octulosonate cytidylyltransferase n=1 Tax=Belliella baltica (strain DSM 15883 / CIP 108006 / LMG 21964 / BA134) TaxID=866536 RepID=I3Z9F2_BELBD|nr:3-deoxy-manno-octulosonate cytidylyltransferase [Belliella baltica]AFL85870.1 3-deoxy-D-manno-octulosonate cytidylyltransferase [Belliella baltica DSM 15883]
MKKIKIAALIPARFASTRLHAKLIQDLCGFSVIQTTFLSAQEIGIFDRIIIATDHKTIQTQIVELGGEVFLSSQNHESGSDRIAEAAVDLDCDLIINIQGDEPFLDKETLLRLIEAFKSNDVQVASLMFEISEEEAKNPNAVKVVFDHNYNALYFSRSLIPYDRDKKQNVKYWKHMGIYGYKKDFLLQFTKWEKSQLEKSEMLEQLRILENGSKIRMVQTSHQAISIDTIQDLEQARNFLKNKRS